MDHTDPDPQHYLLVNRYDARRLTDLLLLVGSRERAELDPSLPSTKRSFVD